MRRLLIVGCFLVGHDNQPSGRTIRSNKSWGPAHSSPIIVEFWDCTRCGARNTWESWQWEVEWSGNPQAVSR